VSRQNVEVVRRIYEGPTSLDAMAKILEFLDPDIEWAPAIARRMTGASYRGHAGVRQWVEDTLEVWEEFWPEPAEFIDAGDHVIVDVRWRGRGRASAIEVDEKVTQVFTFRAGKITRAETFTDKRRALEAAGMTP
jgi:ketosteroid isomerase-like protein